MVKDFDLLRTGFLSSAQQHPDRNALWVDNQGYTYTELLAHANSIAAILMREGTAHTGRCALLVDRSFTAYSAVLGALLAGMTYVPLNAKFPAQRNLRMVELSSSSFIIVDQRSMEAAAELLQAYPEPLRVLLPDTDSLPQWAAAASQHTFVLKAQLAAPVDQQAPVPAEPDSAAYILFTSGSTGLPKGVAVSNRNASTYVRNIIGRYQPTPDDRFTQFFDFTFDLSVHDMFVCWSAGACLYCVPSAVLMMPARFVQEHQLTFWFSVPSLAGCLKRYRALKPGLLPSLKWSLFCGEALPTSLAQDWQPAAPNSIIDNLYGPTEATIAFTAYRYRANDAAVNALPVVPIGQPLAGQEVIILDEQQQPAGEGQTGELYLGGSQVALGYWDSTELTRQRFVEMEFSGKKSVRWYRTGDLASWDKTAGLLYCGRIDNQVKIRGYRVELQEIEAVIRRLSGTDLVAVVPWPIAADGSVQGVVAYGCGFTASTIEILKGCIANLPSYMVPQEIYELEKMPFNSNGKIDYPALRGMIPDAQAASTI